MSRLIDADALLRKLKEHYNKADGKKIYHPSMELAMHDVESAPTIDAVPVVHGRWEFYYTGTNKDMVLAECPECGAVFKLTAFDFGLCYNYCPNCGAKMDLEVDGE